jgi:hypothetical protein
MSRQCCFRSKRQTTEGVFLPFVFCLLLSLSLLASRAHAITCLVDATNTLPNNDFTDLPTALALCRAGNDPNVTLLLNGAFDLGAQGLSFPTDVQNVALVSVSQSPGNVTLSGSQYIVDVISLYPALFFYNLTFDLQATNNSLFYPKLTNQNLTIQGCIFSNFSAQANETCTIIYDFSIPFNVCTSAPTLYLLQQEACTDNVWFVLINNTFDQLPNGAYDMIGLAGFDIERNEYPNSGSSIANNTAMGRVRTSDIATGIMRFNQNNQWRCAECRRVPCDYAIFNDTYEFACNSGQVQCINRQQMNLLAQTNPGFCPVGNYQVVDELTQQTVTVTNDYNPLCTQFISCACNTVVYLNTSSNNLVFFGIGNILLKSGEILPCVPAPGSVSIPLPPELAFQYILPPIIGDSTAVPPIGVPTYGQAVTPINGTIYVFAEGVIVNPLTNSSSCSCDGSGQISGRDPVSLPCEYIIVDSNTTAGSLNGTLAEFLGTTFQPSIPEGPNATALVMPFNPDSWIPSICQEGTMYCCTPPDKVQAVYKHDCSLSPTECEPAVFPNGTIVDPFLDTYYNCEYLANCSYTDGGITNCTRFRCSLLQCHLCVQYSLTDVCFGALNLGTVSTSVDVVIPSGSSGAVSFTLDAAGYVSTGILTNVTDQDIGTPGVYVAMSGGVVVSAFGPLSVCTLANATIGFAVLTNTTLSNGTVLPSVVIVANQVVVPAQLNSTTIVSAALFVIVFVAPYPACNKLTTPTTDPMCLFARNNCSVYYGGGNYPISPYVLNGTAIRPGDNVTKELSQVCSFNLDLCVFFNDTRCSCANCELSSCELAVIYPTNSSCFELLDIGTGAQNITMAFSGSTLGTMTVGGASAVVDVLLTGGTDAFGIIGTISQVGGTVQTTTGVLSVTTLYGGHLDSALILNATFPNGTAVNLTISGGVLVTPSGIVSTTFMHGTFASGVFVAPYPACNDLTIPTTDPLCVFLRDDCEAFYDPITGLPLNPFQLPTLCPLAPGPIHKWPINESLFLNVTPPACEFSSSANCMPYLADAPGSSFDDRCDCAPITTLCSPNFTTIFNTTTNTTETIFAGCLPEPAGSITGFVNFTTVLGAVITSNTSGLPPTKIPRVVFPRGRLQGLESEFNCTTDLWYACDCPSYYSTSLTITACVGVANVTLSYNGPNCTYTVMTVAVCDDLNTNPPDNVTICIPPPAPEYWTLYFDQIPLTCNTSDNSMACDCGATFINLVCPPPSGSVTYAIENLPTTAVLQIIDNSACWHFNALRYKQVPFEVVNTLNIAPQPWYDMYSLLRNTAFQRNLYLIGTAGDIVENDYKTPYRRECSQGCLSDYWAPTSEDSYECVVDASVDMNLPGYGSKYFSSLYQITQAIEGGACSQNRTVLIKYNQEFYLEPQSIDNYQAINLQLVFGASCSDFVFASLDGAVIVGSNFGLSGYVGKITFVGITFVYAADSSGGTNSPVFTLAPPLNRGVGRLVFIDCFFQGNGAGNAGVLSLSRLYNLDVRYCTFANWNYFTVRALTPDRIVWLDNTMIACNGRALQFRFNYFARVQGVDFLTCRGGTGLEGVTTLSMYANDGDVTCGSLQPELAELLALDPTNTLLQNFLGAIQNSQNLPGLVNQNFAPGSGSLVPQPLSMLSMTSNYTRLIPPNLDYSCAFWENNDITDPLATDEEDTFITLSGGASTILDFADLYSLKRQYGVQFLFTTFIGSPTDQDLAARRNPGVRPHLFRSPDPPNGIFPGADFRGWGYNEAQFNLFNQLVQQTHFQCNWPCNSTVTMMGQQNGSLYCQVNNNWDTETMPIDCYELGALCPRYGYLQWNNASAAVLLCEDYRTRNGQYVPNVYIGTVGGSRWYSDNITMDRSVAIIGDTSAPGTWCTFDKQFPPCIRSNGNTCQAGQCYISNLCFQLSQTQLGDNLWQTGDPIPWWLELHNTSFDGRNIQLNASMLSLLAYVGVTSPPVLNQAPQTTALPGPSNGTFIMQNCTTENFTCYDQYAPAPNQPGRANSVVLNNFPFTSGVQVTFVNLLNTNTTCVIVNNTFVNIDRTSLAVIGPINATITDNLIFNGSGRSYGNVAAL